VVTSPLATSALQEVGIHIPIYGSETFHCNHCTQSNESPSCSMTHEHTPNLLKMLILRPVCTCILFVHAHLPWHLCGYLHVMQDPLLPIMHSQPRGGVCTTHVSMGRLPPTATREGPRSIVSFYYGSRTYTQRTDRLKPNSKYLPLASL
jgi:hypothetical protein